MNIVQIGTNIANDDLTNLLQPYKLVINKFIAVEPLEVHNPLINKCYLDIPQLIIENIAITPISTNELLTFYYHIEDGPEFQVASTDKNHILKHVVSNPKLIEEGIIELKVKCLTLTELFDKYDLSTIDILFIDAEGLDFELIKSINFEKYKILNIIYEHLHINGEEAILFLESKGYHTIRNYGFNGWSHAAVLK
jgi:FkbM family methyltransferase